MRGRVSLEADEIGELLEGPVRRTKLVNDPKPMDIAEGRVNLDRARTSIAQSVLTQSLLSQ